MNTQKIRKKIREQVTAERVAIAVGAIVTYTYMMKKLDYRMVRPSHMTNTHIVFDEAFKGITTVRIAEQ